MKIDQTYDISSKNGYDIQLVNGEYSNIKITTDFDLEIINILIKKIIYKLQKISMIGNETTNRKF